MRAWLATIIYGASVNKMCNFLSAIITRDGRVICDPENTDSHKELVAANDLGPDTGEHWIRVEFLPPSDSSDVADSSTYTLKIDETLTPGWFDTEAKTAAEAALRRRIDAMIVRDDRKILLGGCYIITGGRIKAVKNGRIVAVYGSAEIGTVSGNAKISAVFGNAKIGSVFGSAEIGTVYDNAKISDVFGNAKIGASFMQSCPPC